MDSSAILGITAVILTSTIHAFVPPQPIILHTTTPAWRAVCNNQQTTSLSVSIGIGPEDETTTATTDERIILGEDGQPLPHITNHEPYRMERLSKSDIAADNWYASLLESNSPSFLGSVSSLARERILTPVELVDAPKYEYGHEEWTPYSSRRLPTSKLYPAYGCERFGLPVCRRGAEAWRQFDVGGLCEVDYSGVVQGVGTDMSISESEATEIITSLQSKGAWIDDNSCTARLVYINGRFCPILSKQTDHIKNLDSSYFDGTNDELSEQILTYLNRLPDGFTDELAVAVDDETKGPLTSLKKLSGPDHCVGEPTSQFAINNQQGTAAFAALNSVKAGSVGYIELDKSVQLEKPVLIVNAQTPSGGKSGDDESGVAIHPRLLCVAHDESKLSLIQSNVDLNEDSDEIPKATFVNGFTQIFVGANANVTHCYLEESGGTATARVEMSDEELEAAAKTANPETFVRNPREVEAQRPGLRNTHFQTVDVHVTGEEGAFETSLMQLGGTGRSRIAITTTLLRPGAISTINGFSLSGGAQRSDMRTNIHHIAQGTFSKQDQRNMVGGRSTASFRGRIRVEQSAQQMESDQLSRTILLSDHARIWATPSLEIIADDVKCTHGATVSDLSEEELFYLRSRGLDMVTARNILMYAFAEEIACNIDKTISGEFDDENGLRSRIINRLLSIVPEGEKEFVGGEFQSS